MKKKELNTMNAIACLLVILIHVLSFAIGALKRNSWQLVALFFPWKVSGFVVPMFLYTGAVKMGLYYSKKGLSVRDYSSYVLKRIKKIYLPYVLWVIIYYIAFIFIGYVRGDIGEFFLYLLDGNLSSPFYYVIIVMQFYLLLPVWVWMVKKVPAYVGVLGAVLVTLISYQLPNIVVGFKYFDRVFPSYLIFWVIGLYAGKYYESVVNMLRNRSGLIISVSGVLFYLGLSYFQYRTQRYFFNMGTIKIVNDILSIALVQAIALKLNDVKGRIRGVIDGIYESSFSVYLSHCLFLTIFTYYLQIKGVTDIKVLIAVRFLVCYTLPFLLYKAKKDVLGRVLRRKVI